MLETPKYTILFYNTAFYVVTVASFLALQNEMLPCAWLPNKISTLKSTETIVFLPLHRLYCPTHIHAASVFGEAKIHYQMSATHSFDETEQKRKPFHFSPAI